MSIKVTRVGIAASPRRRQRGLTLIELVVFMVIVSVALTGVLVTFNTVVRASADPLVSRQLQAIAEALLEEVLLQDYKVPPSSTGGLGPTRVDYDNVDNYKNYNSGNAGITDPKGVSVAGLSGYKVEVSVGTEVDWGTPPAKAKLITVKASHSGQSFSLSGYRTEDPVP